MSATRIGTAQTLIHARRRARRREDWIGAAFGLLAVLPAACSFFAGAGVVLWQFSKWLELARWPTPTVLDYLSWSSGHQQRIENYLGSYLGLNEIIRWTLELPLGLWLMVVQPVLCIAAWAVVFK